MEEIDDFAAFICYNMILSSLPIDQRGRGDFGEYLRADEHIVRRLLGGNTVPSPKHTDGEQHIAATYATNGTMAAPQSRTAGQKYSPCRLALL